MDWLTQNIAWNLYRRVQPCLDPLVFLHLPKCGGTSVNIALNKLYWLRLHRTLHLSGASSKQAAEVIGEPVERFRARLLAFHMAEQKRRLITGHYGFDEHIWDHFSDAWKFMTVLRDPVARWYSSYFYNRYKTKSDHYRISQPLEIFVETDRARKGGDMYARFLTGRSDADDAVSQVIENLHRFHLVGLLEEAETFIQDCQQLLGVKINVPRHNVSPRSTHQQSEEITPEIDAKVRALCASDLQIYRAVQGRILSQGTWLKQG